ncbi:hypothetical protein ACUNV4_08575 [Granulosicoccus sp. 3-233]|uniref:hypothetical protein n=1 Tax=Granulosicoccus sp. 3-233 TaxID=3417969 RepID=UPI003D32B929
MYVTGNWSRFANPTLTVLVLAAGIGLGSMLLPEAAEVGSSVSASARCLDAADVLAARDRSRNGVSLTCNEATVTRELLR